MVELADTFDKLCDEKFHLRLFEFFLLLKCLVQTSTTHEFHNKVKALIGLKEVLQVAMRAVIVQVEDLVLKSDGGDRTDVQLMLHYQFNGESLSSVVRMLSKVNRIVLAIAKLVTQFEFT